MIRLEINLRWLAVALLVATCCATRAPAQAPPTEPAPASPQASTLLADPAVAERIKLSDEQRMQIAALLAQRADSLAKAQPDARADVAKGYEAKLLAVLSDDQRAQLTEGAANVAKEPKLRFNFRFQRWSDVLEWFAEQAGLSLVLDAPPPGTFNYNDDREYTVAESLDLLNGVLLTKGYTLVRRERMLILVDLSQGVPETLVPRVELNDLDKRGRFEIVSVLFPVGTRDANEVITEIAPLLGPRGKSQPLPKTKQVLVTDTAGVMRAIHAVIESMPEPKKPPAPPAAEKPQLVVYPLKSADPAAAVEVLTALMPEAQFVRDPKANQISAYATPTQQAAVKRVIDQMQTTEGPAESRARFEVYPLDDVDPQTALAALQPLVPAARLSVDAATKKLAAWAAAADHEILKKAVSQLTTGTAGVDDRQIEVYRLSKADPASMVVLLQNVVPRARLAVDPPTKSIVALATLDDQKTIRATLDQLESPKPSAGTPQLRFYPLGQTAPGALSGVLQTLVPRATVTVDAPSQRLAVIATPEDHEAVKAAIDEYLKSTPGGEKRQLVLYPVSPAERKRFQAVLGELTAELPNVKVITDAEPGELAVWANEEEHKVIADIVKQLKQESPTDASYKLVAYPIRVADPASVLSVLQNLFPATKLVLDTKTRRLVAWTRPAEQESIKSLIEQMDTDEPGGLQNQLMVYPVVGFDPNAAITTLKTLVPDATLTVDTTAQTIVAFARKADQEKIAAALERMHPGTDPATRPHVTSYPVGTADPNALVSLIGALVPTARVAPNPASGTIAVWATPDDHRTIKAAIDELTNNQSNGQAAKVVVYTLNEVDAANVTSALQTAVPQARIGVGQNQRKLVVWARPAEHETIRSTLAELDKKEFHGQPRVLKAYVIETGDAGSLVNTLQALFATKYNVRISLDGKTNSIAALATPDDQREIKAAIDELTSEQSSAGAEKVVVYTLKATNASNITAALQAAVPQARIGVGQNQRKLVVSARPGEHETIRTTLAELDTGELDGGADTLKSYAITTADPNTVLGTLQTLFATRPTVRLSLDNKNNKIVAMATPAEHETIARVIEEIERGSPLDAAAKFEVHPLRNADPTSVMSVLQNLFPATKLVLDADSKQLVAVATPEQQQTIRDTIDQFQAAGRQLEVFQLDIVDPLSAELAIEKLFADTSRRGRRDGEAPIVESDATSARLYVRASQDDLAEIRNLLVKMGEARLARSNGTGGNVRIIPFSGDTAAALAEIERIWPRLRKNPLRVLHRPGGTPSAIERLPAKPNRLDDRKQVEPKKPPPPAANPDQQTRRDQSRTIVEFKTAAHQDEPQATPDQETPKPAEKTKQPAPIIVSPGENSITIMSDDREAIEQFEALLRTLSPPAGTGGREIRVYPLRSANSTTVAELLKRIFRSGGFAFGDSFSPAIEADERLNAVIVYAGRNDRAVIESLLEALDSDEVPESLIANRPTVIPVKNTSAENVESVLRDIYQTQLTSGAPKKQIPIPGGASREVAAVIQQINTAATGPLMTMGVDETTNALVVMAPGPLAQEVAELVAELDEAALHDTSRSVKIVRLRSANADQVREVLDQLIRGATQRQSGGRRGRR